MSFLEDAKARGFIQQGTDLDELENHMRENRTSAYIGFDCTADSLHVGSLVQIMLLRLLQKHRHQPFALIGGATTRIGDPSGKDQSRQMLSDWMIQQNGLSIQTCLFKFDDVNSNATIHYVNNSAWMDRLLYVDILREVGQHFTINRMLTMDSVRSRLERESPMTFLEFNYMVFQSYDFLELFKRHGVVLQIGGSDQWGNIVSGVDLIRRVIGKQVFGLTTPLIETASGKKMGKTEDGAIWLTEDKTSVYDYWQFWRNTEDKDVGRFLRLFTDIALDEIELLEKLEGNDLNVAKVMLANAATTIAHGAPATLVAHDQAIAAFSEGTPQPDRVVTFDNDEGAWIVEILRRLGMTDTNGAAKRLIAGGGVRINDEQISDSTLMVTRKHIRADGLIKVSVGPKRHKFIRVLS
jgi:tyrosyl-tRNA synthetase